MAATPRNALVANGQALIGELAWPTGGGPKWHPYNIAQTREALHPQLTAVARDASGAELEGRTVTWSSSASSVATVSSSGVVTGVAAGEATITASVEGRTASARVTVVPVPVAG